MTDLTRKQLAAELAMSERTLRRLLPRIPGLRCNRVGRLITFAPADVAMIRDAMRSPHNTAATAIGRRVVASASVLKLSSSASSAQERVRELTRRPSRRRTKGNPFLPIAGVMAREPAP
jgi:hypothetical protein